MRTMYLIDLVYVAFGLALFLALLTASWWWPVVRALVWSLIDHFFVVRWNGIVMSCDPVRDGSEPAEPEAGPPDTDAERTTLDKEKDAPSLPAPDDITDEQLVKLLAAMKRADGSNRWSGNAIAAFVGGTRAQVLEWISEARPRPPAPAVEPRASVPGEAPPPAGSLRRPREGW